ncbi:hypothetical protein C5U62_22750 [Pseudomonas protegens]|uniref:Uncharacterized protein n=1 Tax=Pseudomonas protegens TaxID=380021 RepID=A0A2T6GH17_9PSED|nr:hypothetical protein [Pseudomonas protegens]PUA43450.1 hypothetical protein C5U62_22750 [Pseudomonas protegens]
MSIVPIDVGQEPNDETGDPLRDGGIKINANFAELDTRTAAAQAKAEQGVADAAAARTKADQGIADAAAAKAKADAAVPAAALGTSVAQLVNGVVPASQLPSFVDDVLEFPARADFPGIGETGKIYIAINDGDSPTNPTRQYRWSGATYVLIPSSPGSTDQVPEGASNQYFTAARVRSTTLAGLGALVNAAIVAGDTVLQALAKLQGQLNAKLGRSEVATDSDKLGGQPAAFYTAPFVGATASTAGIKGLVPAPAAGDQLKFLGADGLYRIPDGPAEVVTNANGTAIKFPDGTMICYAQGGAEKTTSNPNGYVWAGNEDTFTYPVPFKTLAGVIPTVAYSLNAYVWCCVGAGQDLVKCTINGFSGGSNGKYVIRYMAIGRWK